MTSLVDKLTILGFNIIAFFKGYRFKQVENGSEFHDFETLYASGGFHFPEELEAKVNEYKHAAVNFIAYYKGVPVGTVRLGDPNIKNRPFELLGIDEKAEHFEIQSLMVKKEFRDGTHFVMLGLFKAMYVFSIKHSVSSWISGSTRSVYQTIRRYNKNMKIIEQNQQNFESPVANYLFANNIIDFYYTMQVKDFSPQNIFKIFLNQLIKQVPIPQRLSLI